MAIETETGRFAVLSYDPEDEPTSLRAAVPTESWACLQRPSIRARKSSTSRSCWFGSSSARFSFNRFEEFALAILLAFEAETDERGDRLAHTDINRLGVPLYLIGDTGWQSDRISRLDFAEITLPSALPAAAAAFGCCRGVRHISSGGLNMMQLGKCDVNLGRNIA